MSTNRICAIYGRAATVKPVDGQIARCRVVAAQHGYEAPEHLVFTDVGVSGLDPVTRRKGYQALLAAVTAGEISAIVVDDLQRLSIDEQESARFMKLIQDSGVRLISLFDGLDSDSEPYNLMLGLMFEPAPDYSSCLSYRIKRGIQAAKLRKQLQNS